MSDNLPVISFAADATIADVVALYTASVSSRVRSYKVQEGVDLTESGVERVDLMFVDNAAAKRFVASLYAQDAWSFIGDAYVSKVCDYKVCVIVDTV